MRDQASDGRALERDATRVIGAGLPDPVPGEPFLPGPTLASVFHAPGDPSTVPYTYGRYGNPTWERYEEAVGSLEGGAAVVFPSGMAAISALLLTLLTRGDVLTFPSDAYFGTRALVDAHFRRQGIEVRAVPTGGREVYQQLPGTTLLWLETPSNPGLDVCDLAELAALAHAGGAVVVADNTMATPLGQRPLELGADYSVVSATKQMTGYGDLLLGYVATADPARAQAIRDWRRLSGSIPGPHEVWLAHRSLFTLEMRLRRQGENGLRLAEALAARPDVGRVRYPGLPGDPSYDLARRQMRHFGAVVTFDVGSHTRADAFLDALRLVASATSFGGLHSTAERRGRWGGDSVPEGFIRFSVGSEDADDLIADVTRALAATAVVART